MFRKKFVSLFQTLTPAEGKEFEHYLKGLYPGQKKAAALFDYLKKFHPRFHPSKKLEMEYVYKKVFGETIETGHNRKNFLNYLSELHVHLKEFLLWKEVKKESFEQSQLWLHILNDRKKYKDYHGFSSQLKQEHENKEVVDVWHFLKGTVLNYLSYYNANTHQFPDIENLNNCLNHLDQFYLSLRLKLICEIANWNNIVPEHDGQVLQLSFLELVQKSELKTTAHIYFLLFNLIEGQTFTAYKKAKLFFLEHRPKLEKDEQSVILSYLLNYTAVEIKNGNTMFFKEAFELNKFAVMGNVFIQDGYMAPNKFLNIINAACKVDETEWATDFIEQNYTFLETSVRKSTSQLGAAILLFEKGQFSKSLLALNQVEFNNIYFAIRAKCLTLINFIELDEDEDLLLGYCNSFMRFLAKNKKIKKGTITATKNFVTYSKKILLGKSSQEKLKKEIAQTPLLYFKDWLIKKAQYYKPKFAGNIK